MGTTVITEVGNSEQGGATVPLVIIAEGAGTGGYAYHKNVTLLLNCQGADNSMTFTDESPNPKTITAFGNAKISSNALLCDGTGDYLKTDDDARVAAFGKQNAWTVEFFLSPTDGGHGNTFARIMESRAYGETNDGFAILCQGSDNPALLRLDDNGANAQLTMGSTVPNGSYTHVLWSYDGTTLRVYKDGVHSASSVRSIYFSASQLSIGSNLGGSESYKGSLRGVRITDGVAAHTGTASFTPPTWPLPAYAGQINVTITENTSGITNFRAVAIDASSGRFVGEATTNASTVTIPCDAAVPCIVNLFPADSADYGDGSVITSYGPVTPS